MNWTIGKRLFALGATGVAMVAATGAVGFIGSSNINDGMHQMTVATTALRNHMEGDMMHDALRADVLAALLADTTDAQKQVADDLREHSDNFRKMIEENEKADLGQAVNAQLAAVRPKLDAYIAGAERAVELARTDRAAAKASLPQFLALFGDLEEELGKLSEEVEGTVTTAGNAQDHAVAQFRQLVAAAGGVAFLMLAAVSTLITRKTNRTLSQLAESLGNGSRQAASASNQVSASSQSLAQGASEQAASLEETSSALEEMSSMTKRNAETAQQAAALSAEAKESADKGNTAMSRMSTAINEIQTSATETAKIIKVIDEIAFQTNLLALNAAVEAARAGEAGKGFAVVAEEVRNLAMRSAEAAKNTAAMIEGSVGNARNGVAIAAEVAKTLAEITAVNTKVNALIGEIAAASNEQAQGIGQVNSSVTQMDTVTQSNAAAAEESASASEELASQAEQLKQMAAKLSHLVGGAAEMKAAA
jgi:methyl-accepting chemotaxis protein